MEDIIINFLGITFCLIGISGMFYVIKKSNEQK